METFLQLGALSDNSISVPILNNVPEPLLSVIIY